MNILLTNDDGIYADGLWTLHDHLSKTHTVTVVAPDRERSAIGHAITLHEPLRAETVSVNGWGTGTAVTGTPADCVKLAIVEILGNPPEMVISGFNPGANIGVNLNYSGTVSAAKEAALYGIPALAASVDGRSGRHYEEMSRFIGGLVSKVVSQGLPFGTFLNVNFPDLSIREMGGVRISRQAVSMLSESFERRKDPRDQTYFWQGCDTQNGVGHPETDIGALHDRCISITPVKCDMTDHEMVNVMKGWADINLSL
jgi:5'-nucleotidase